MSKLYLKLSCYDQDIDESQVKRIGQAIYNRQVNGHIENHFFILYEIHADIEPKLNHESVGFKWFTDAEINNGLIQTPNLFGAAFHFVWNTFYN